MRLRLTAALAAGLAMLSACGSDPEPRFSEEEQRAVDALTASLLGAGPGGKPAREPTELERRQHSCTAERVVEELGVEHLQKVGLLSEGFEGRIGQVKVDRETAGTIADAAVACYDVDGLVEQGKQVQPDVPPRAWEAYGDCLEPLLPLIRDSVAEANTEGAGTKAQRALDRRLTACNERLARHQGG